MDMLFSSAYGPFVAALIAMLVVVLLEGAGLLLSGTTFSGLGEMLVDVDSFPATALTNWWIVRGLPLSIAICLFLSCFGSSGYALQTLAIKVTGEPLALPLAVALAAVLGWVGLLTAGKALAPLFGSHTTSVSVDSFVGAKTSILSPVCNTQKQAEVRVLDGFGHQHMFMVVPADTGQTFVRGDEVVFHERLGPALFSVRKLEHISPPISK